MKVVKIAVLTLMAISVVALAGAYTIQTDNKGAPQIVARWRQERSGALSSSGASEGAGRLQRLPRVVSARGRCHRCP